MKTLSLSALLLLFSFVFVGSRCASGNKTEANNNAPSQEQQPEPEPGTDPEPVYTIGIDKEEVRSLLTKISGWQISNFSYSKTGSGGHLHDYGIDAWTNGTLYLGMYYWSRISSDGDYYKQWLYNDIGSVNKWRIPANFTTSSYKLYHADELCIGQFYMYMYGDYKNTDIYSSTKERVDWIIANPPSESMKASAKQSWTWCDALFMAPPVYVHLANLTGDGKYLDFMHLLYLRTYNYLYDKQHRLFFRDDNYFDKFEANGEKVFWGRGNGWVAAGLVEILKLMPENYIHRGFYMDLFREFIPRLVELRDGSGFWHASLLDPVSYPAPETSATALNTYAIAYGISAGLLDAETYIPILETSWHALTTVVEPYGKVGYVQPIGADPKNVTRDMTAVYGVGAMLMAGSEIYDLILKLNNI